MSLKHEIYLLRMYVDTLISRDADRYHIDVADNLYCNALSIPFSFDDHKKGIIYNLRHNNKSQF